MTLRNRVDEALKAVDLQPSDMAAVALARLYADEIDRIDARVEAGTDDTSPGLKEYGPKFLSALDALGLTPKARQARSKTSKGGTRAPEPVDPADEIRKRREQRRAGA